MSLIIIVTLSAGTAVDQHAAGAGPASLVSPWYKCPSSALSHTQLSVVCQPVELHQG